MSEIYETFSQMNSSDLLKLTFLPGSEFGPTHRAGLVGAMTARYGQAAVLASLSARQAKDLGLLTSGTSGPPSTISSASASLTLSLANRLRARTVSAGSRVYRLTWKLRVMPSGRSIPALRASPMSKAKKGSTSDSASTGEPSGWRTPTALSENAARGRGQDPFKRLAQGHTLDLQSQVLLAGWPTPTTRDHKDGDSVGTAPTNGLLGRVVWLAGWATPKASDGSGGRTTETKGGGNVHLDKQARLAGWPTPMAGTPAQNGNNEAGNTDSSRKTVALTGSGAETGSVGRLRAGHSRWLMRIPNAWDACAPTATRSTRRKPKPS